MAEIFNFSFKIQNFELQKINKKTNGRKGRYTPMDF